MSEQTTPTASPAGANGGPGVQTTRLNTRWVIKTGLVLLIGLVLGVWGFIDARYIYPNRGIEDASYKQREYLRVAQKAGVLDGASIPDPEARRGSLAARRTDLEKAVSEVARLEALAGSAGPDAARAMTEIRRLQGDLVEAASLQWLDALALVNRLKREFTEMPAPAESLRDLDQKWKAAPQPLPLAAYDLPVQWFITYAGFGVAAWVIFRMFIPALRTRYSWDPAEQRLTLPGGRSLTPGDIAEFDKRLWDKLFIHLHIKESAGGGVIKLDLLRYVPLEEWILTMERTAFPETAPPLEPMAAEAEAAGNAGEANPNQ